MEELEHIPDDYISEKEKKRKKAVAIVIVTVLSVLILLLATALIIQNTCTADYYVEGHSMDPSFDGGVVGDKYDGDKVFVWKNAKLKRGDVVVFTKPDGDTLIKRVIGLPGDTVRLNGSEVYVNDELLFEKYINRTYEGDPGMNPDAGWNHIVVTLGEGQYFVMGDNRNNSSDSRDFGPVQESWIEGKVFLVMPMGTKSLKTIPKAYV